MTATTKLALIVEITLTAITFIEGLDLSVKAITCLSALIVAYFAVRAHISKRRLDDLNYRQQLKKLKEDEDNKDSK